MIANFEQPSDFSGRSLGISGDPWGSLQISENHLRKKKEKRKEYLPLPSHIKEGTRKSSRKYSDRSGLQCV